MSAAFEQAWLLLKAYMPPFVPRNLDEQIGIGSYRAAYKRPNLAHTTKYGTGEKLADAMVLGQLAEYYPEAFVGEQLHPLPTDERNLPKFTMTERESGEPLFYGPEPEYLSNEYFDYGADGGHNVMPLTYTQQLGGPITSDKRTQSYEHQKEIQDRMRQSYPLAHALGLGDVKHENWAVMQGGLDIPEISDEQVKLIDPMFDYPRQRPFYTPEFTREARRFQQDLPELRDFAEPWYKGLDRYEDPELAQRILDTIIQGEQENLNAILNPLNP
tara:strand:- start:107 stop:922 length:816 start_codon:yes stop_codon:yes gene_type:complete